MKVSVCITTKNEEESISSLIDSLLLQSNKADEIVIVDALSTDKTAQIIRYRQKFDQCIKFYEKKCTRGEGRNLSVKIAKNKIIAMTDAGCVPDKDWLKNITKPFAYRYTDVVAGFYKMKSKGALQKAMSVFLGTTPSKFDKDFLPSTRSVAFRKEIWEKVGGFDESLASAEDTDFNFRLLENNAKFARVKKAIVEWGMPGTINEFGKKIYEYAKADASSKRFFYTDKSYTSHNVRAVLIVGRYVLGAILLALAFTRTLLLLVLGAVFVGFLIRAYKKAFDEYKSVLVGMWSVFLQFLTDFFVMKGFMEGIWPQKKRG